MASTTLEEKINKIRQKNEEIRRRHEEVEADKQNAAKLNALVKMVPPTDWPERKEPPEFSNPPPPRSNGNSKPKASGREYRGQQQQYHAGGGDGKKVHVFAEGDGPPPDPTYNFLADSEREERTREDLRENDRFRGRGGPLRGSSRRRGGGREGYSKEYRGSAGPKDASKPEYEAWRAERNRIDEARISRQRTAEGNWRREWDNNKINVEEDETGATKSARLDLGDTVRKDHKEFDKWQVDGNDHDSPRGRGGKQYVSRGGPRGSHTNRAYQHSNSFEQFHGPVSPSPTKPPLSPNGIDERMVVATDKSIKVIVNHGTTPPKGPVMSVKVSSSSIAGTGRVGPRQKPRVLYSSQSETEPPGHELDKFSGHKSADDKGNRVSFNRDLDEQQRYAPKSPHPQRKAENNAKSPYSARKEFKYDSQQQRHGEADPKSPYLQRKEIKDCPKSPHFQRKTDFNNRDLHGKQKNNPGTDSFKSAHSQRRNPDKTKHDSQKFSAPRKFDDPSAPKPQRTNKRTDKSKHFQHSNSKDVTESSTSETNAQINDLGVNVVEESAKSVANGIERHNEVDKFSDSCGKDSFEDAVTVETAKENQNGDDDVSKLHVDAEVLSASNIDFEKVRENIPDDTKLIDNSEPIIQTQKDATECLEEPNAADNETEKESIVQNDEIKPVAESATLISSESKADESNENVAVFEESKETPDISSIAQEEVKIQTVIKSKTQIDSDEITNVENKTEGKPGDEVKSSPAGNLENMEKSEKVVTVESEKKDEILPEPEKIANEIETNAEKLEEKVITVEHEKKDEISPEHQKIANETEENTETLQEQVVTVESEKKDEITPEPQKVANEIEENTEKLQEQVVTLESEKKDETLPEPEKIANEMEEARNIVESTSVEEKVDSPHETEAHQSGEEQISNNVDKQIVKDSEDKENPVI